MTVCVKDVARPSLVELEGELLRAMQRAGRSIALQDGLFVVLTKVDLFDRPDENGNWHWRLAVENFKAQAIDRVFPYSKVWAHQGVDGAHPVARQIQDYYNQTQPVSGLEQLQAAAGRHLSAELEKPHAGSVRSMGGEFSEREIPLPGPAWVVSGVAPALVERAGMPMATLADPAGWPRMVCASTCRPGVSPGGCNTLAQVLDYFDRTFSAPRMWWHMQYGTFTGTSFAVSRGGCCGG